MHSRLDDVASVEYEEGLVNDGGDCEGRLVPLYHSDIPYEQMLTLICRIS